MLTYFWPTVTLNCGPLTHAHAPVVAVMLVPLAVPGRVALMPAHTRLPALLVGAIPYMCTYTVWLPALVKLTRKSRRGDCVGALVLVMSPPVSGPARSAIIPEKPCV